MTTYSVNNTEQEKKIYCGKEYEYNLTTNTQYNYIYVGDDPIAVYIQNDSNKLYYLYTNHNGSIEKITNTKGDVVDAMSYTPFGKRRMSANWHYNDTAKHLIDRGFTGQQHLDNFALINFNGRMYDPVLAHFLSPDPYIQSPENPLNHNRYSYCLFSPLQYVDPTGLLIDWVERIINGKKEIYYDRDIKSQEDIDALYGKNSGIKHLPDGSIIEGKYIIYNDHINNRDGLILDINGNLLNNDRNIISEYNYTIFAGTTDESVNAKTLHKNLFGTSYTGPNNPTDYNGNTTYEYLPRNRSEYGSIIHDLMYDNANVKGFNGALLCTDVWKADAFLTIYNIMNANNPTTPFLDKMRSTATAIGFGIITSYKMTIHALKKINNKIGFSFKILCSTILVLLLLNYSCTFFASGSYPMAEWYNVETSFTELDNNINLFKSKYPQYDVIVRNDDNFFSSMDKIHNNYKLYYFYFSDIQLTILCVAENDTISNHKNTAIGLVRIIESPGYISTDITHQDINLHLSKKANNAIKAKFEKEILEHIGNWEKISSSKKNYWGKNKNSSFTKKIIKSIKKQESVISYDSIKWTTINLQESLGNDYDTLYLFSNSSKKQIENIIGIPYQQGDFWSKETYLILLKKGKHIVYREEISRFPYFENIYINFNIPQRNKKLPNCILKSGNPNYFIKIENLNGEKFYLLYNAKDSLSIHQKHIWDK